MNHPTPHIGRTISQRRMTSEASKHPSIRAYQQNQRAHYEGQVEQLRELERFERNDAALQFDALMSRVRQAGTGECDQPEDKLTWADVIGMFAADMATTALFLAGWFVFGVGGASLYFLIRGWLA